MTIYMVEYNWVETDWGYFTNKESAEAFVEALNKPIIDNNTKALNKYKKERAEFDKALENAPEGYVPQLIQPRKPKEDFSRYSVVEVQPR